MENQQKHKFISKIRDKISLTGKKKKHFLLTHEARQQKSFGKQFALQIKKNSENHLPGRSLCGNQRRGVTEEEETHCHLTLG